MKNMLHYRGYYGSVEYNQDDGLLFGRVQFVRALISYEGKDARTLRKDFEDAVDDYFAMCAKKRVDPEVPFKGSFNVRVGRDLHRKLAIAAAQEGKSLNKLVAETLEKATTAPA